MHRWGPDKFPKEKPLVFFMKGKPINAPLGIHDGLNVIISSMVSYIEREVPERTLKLWRTHLLYTFLVVSGTTMAVASLMNP
jgi:hypothetical protein